MATRERKSGDTSNRVTRTTPDGKTSTVSHPNPHPLAHPVQHMSGKRGTRHEGTDHHGVQHHHVEA